MFIGHYAVALSAKRAAPRVSLGTLFLASQLVDLLWPLFLLLGWEHVRIDPGNTAVTPLDFTDYPLTHSLLASAVWSVAAGGVYYAVRRSASGARIVGLLVFSHWLLDLLTHMPDLPLAGSGGTMVGLGLWNSIAGTVAVEMGLLAVGVLLYNRATRPADRVGNAGFWVLIAVLVLIYAANLAGPPPPDPFVVAIAGNASWLFVLWAYWIDRHRVPAAPYPREERDPYPRHSRSSRS